MDGPAENYVTFCVGIRIASASAGSASRVRRSRSLRLYNRGPPIMRVSLDEVQCGVCCDTRVGQTCNHLGKYFHLRAVVEAGTLLAQTLETPKVAIGHSDGDASDACRKSYCTRRKEIGNG